MCVRFKPGESDETGETDRLGTCGVGDVYTISLNLLVRLQIVYSLCSA